MTASMAAPFPGLRPFANDDAPWFFGRDAQIADLYARLDARRLVAVVGGSGVGKSSLVLAGLLPRLEADQVWRVVETNPRGAPRAALGEAFIRALVEEHLIEPEEARLAAFIDHVTTTLCRSAMGLVDLAREWLPQDGRRLLALVDQFEEVFRFEPRSEGDEARALEDEAAAYVALLLAAAKAPEGHITVVITMRADYIGDCIRFEGLPEAISDGQYLVPRLTREQVEAVIRRPILQAGATIDHDLVEQLLNDSAKEPDALPVLQHALMRLWDQAVKTTDTSPECGYPVVTGLAEASVPFDPQRRLTLRLYDGLGGMRNALSRHADEVIDELKEGRLGQRAPLVVEQVMRALIEVDRLGRAIRRPITFRELVQETGYGRPELATVVEAMRAETRSFLRPAPNEDLKDEAVIDVGHEALIRRWRRVQDADKVDEHGRPAGWLRDEERDGQTYRALLEFAEESERAGGTPLPEGQTGLRSRWWSERRRTDAWARRYGGRRSKVVELFKLSQRHVSEERERRKREQAERSAREAAEERALQADLTAARAAKTAAEEREQRLRESKEAAEAMAAHQAALADQRATAARRARYLAALAGVAFCIAAVLLGLVYREQERTAAQLERANLAQAEAQLSDSRVRAEQARKELDRGFPVTAMQHALAGLPEDPGKPSARPWVAETAGALVEAAGEQREDLVLRGHEAPVVTAAFSPNGARIVSGAEDGTVRVWDAESNAEPLILRGHEAPVLATAFSPNGRRIVSASGDRTVRVWDAESGAERLVLRGHEGWVGVAAFSPDGARIVSGAEDATVRVWDAESGAERLVLRGHEAPVRAAAFSPDGARIVSEANDHTVWVWDAESGTRRLVLRGHEAPVWAAAFSPDGARIVSGAEDGTVRVWDAESGAERLVLRGHEGWVVTAAFSPDGARIVSGAEDETVRVWDAESGAERLVLRGHEDWVWAAAFSPDGKRIVSAAKDGTVRVWDAERGPKRLILRGHKGMVLATAFSPNGRRILSASSDRTVRVWDAESGAERLVLREHEGWVGVAAFSPDGARIVSGAEDGTVRVWDAESGAERLVLRGHEAPVRAAAFSPDGRRIVSEANDHTVWVWDAESGTRRLVLRGHEAPVWAAAFSPDGARIVSGSEDGTVRVWDAESGAERLVLRGHEDWVLAAAFSPDGARIVSGAKDGTVRVWDAESGAERLVLRGHEAPVRAAAFSPDGRRIVSASGDRTVRVWDAENGENLLILRGHEAQALAAAFSPDGARIASGSEDRTVRVTWVPRSKQELIETARARVPR